MPLAMKIFIIFVISIDGMLERKDLVVLDNLNKLMAEKIEEPILHL